MQRNFFAAGNDLLPILEHVALKHPVAFASAGLFASSVVVRVQRAAVLAANGTGEENTFLVTPASVEVMVRAIPQRAGGTKYAVDELANPSSISLRVGCMAGPNVLIPGMVGTVATDGPASVLHRAFVSAIGKHFKRVQSYWVGPAAFALLAQGVRLTISAGTPPEYDLQLSGAGDV